MTEDEQEAQRIVYADVNLARGQVTDRLIERIAAALRAQREVERQRIIEGVRKVPCAYLDAVLAVVNGDKE